MKNIALILAHPRMVFWLMPWLMLMLLLGTLAQRNIGLYEAERQYFASWIVWFWGVIPTPGIYPTLALLALSLLAKLLLKSPWTTAKGGGIITHIGALLLLLGGLLSSLTAQEGYLSAAEGASSNIVTDYHMREIVASENGSVIWRENIANLSAGETIDSKLFRPFKIEKLYRNAIPSWRENASDKDKGIAQQLDINPLPAEKLDESNMAGAILHFPDRGRYLLYEPMQKHPLIKLGAREFTFAIRKAQRVLPFTVTIDDFDKQVHPGTSMAREYQSLVTIDEGNGVTWQSLIRMNEPLRVQGYTLYQSSFLQDKDGNVISVLAVVKNAGRVFPYIASLVIGLGMLMHLLMRRRKS